MSGFNGGLSQVNVAPLGIGNAYEFLNLLKGGGNWEEFTTNLPVDPSTLDTNGWPTSFSTGGGGVKQSFNIPSQTDRPGRYAITWTSVSGSGGGITISAPARNSPTGSLSAGGGPGGTNRYEFLPGAGDQINFGITTLGGTDYKVFHVDDEASLLAGNMFGDKFKARLIEAKFGVIRFLNWHGFGQTNWASRRPVTYAYYGGDEMRSSMYTGATGGTGNNYTASLSGFSLTDKAAVIVKFDRDATGHATLNVASTGAISVLNPSAFEPFDPIQAGRYCYLVYDQTLNAWLRFGGDTNTGSRYLYNGVPPEIMVRLCIECGAQFEPVTPYLSADPVTDYMPSLAKYCLDNGPVWFKPHFGGVNEVFNFAAMPTSYAIAKANAYGWSDAMHNWMGKHMSTLGQAISTVYGGDRSKYEVICGLQGATGVNLINCQASDNRLKAAEYVANPAQTAQSPLTGPWGTTTFTKSAAHDWVTGISPANYFVPSDYFFAAGMIEAFDYAVTNVGNPTAQAANVTAFLTTLHGPAAPYNLAYVKNTFVQWKAWAEAMPTPVLKVMPYEGGYSPDYKHFLTGPCVAGITAAASAVLKVPSCINGEVINVGNPCVVRTTPMRLVVSGLNGTMGTALNGNTYDITAVSGSDVTINANTTGLAFASCTVALGASAVIHQVGHGYGSFEQGFFTTTGSLYTGFSINTLYFINVVDADNFTLSTTFGGTPITTSGTQSGTHAFCRTVTSLPEPKISIENAPTYWNALKLASKLAPDLGPYLTENYNDIVGAGAAFPSCFQLSGNGNIWSVFDPTVYSANTSQWNAIVAFNH